MKKTVLFVVLSVFLVLAACGNDQKKNEVSVTPAGVTAPEGVESLDTDEPKVLPTQEATEQPTEAPKESSYTTGETFTLGDWEITLDSFEFEQKVKDQYFSSSADEGNKYLVLNYSVKNTGTEARKFTDMIGGMEMKAFFQDKYEYRYTLTMIEDDMSRSSIKPLASKTGFVVIEVPDAVAESEDSLVLNLADGTDKAKITLR